jgi:hypothetical protein
VTLPSRVCVLRCIELGGPGGVQVRPGQACCIALCTDALAGPARSAQRREKLKRLLGTAAKAAAAAAAALDDAGAAAPGKMPRCQSAWAQAIWLKQHCSARDSVLRRQERQGLSACRCGLRRTHVAAVQA